MYFSLSYGVVLRVPSLYPEFIALKKSNEVNVRLRIFSFNTVYYIFKTKSMAIELVNQ